MKSDKVPEKDLQSYNQREHAMIIYIRNHWTYLHKSVPIYVKVQMIWKFVRKICFTNIDLPSGNRKSKQSSIYQRGEVYENLTNESTRIRWPFIFLIF